MRNLSTEFKEQQNSGNRNYLKYADFTFTDGSTLSITDKDLWSNGFKFEDAVSQSGSFDIGAAIVNKLTLQINNFSGKYTDYIWDGARVVCHIGLELSTGIEKIRICTMTVTDAPYQNTAIISLTCEDSMRLFDRDYSESKLSYPATRLQIIQDACEVCGVTLQSTRFDNDDFVIQNRPDDSSITFRQVIAWVAQMGCQWAKTDAYGRLCIGWYEKESNIPANITSKDTSGFTPWLYDLEITGVKVTEYSSNSSESNAKTYQSGDEGYIIDISENKLIQPGTGQTICSIIAERCVGLKFRPFTTSALTDIALEAGDAITITDRNGEEHKSYLTSLTLNPGTFEQLECSAKSVSRNKQKQYTLNQQAQSEYRKSLRDERTSREKALEELSQRLAESSGTYTTVETQPDGSNIYYLHNKPQLSDSDIVWKMTAEAWAVSTDGGQHWNGGMTVDGDVIARILTATGVNADWIKTGALVIKDVNGHILFQADMNTKKVYIDGSVQIGGGVSLNDIKKTAEDAQKAAALAKNMTLQLSNEYQGISVDSSGNYGTFPSGVITHAVVMYGTQDITDDCNFIITKSDSITGIWNNSAKTYTVTGLSADDGWVDVRATYLSALTVTKRFSISKIYAGNDGKNGLPGRTYFLESPSYVIKQRANGSVAPSYITLSAWYRDGNAETRTAYKGRFKIEESVDGENWKTVYSSAKDETSVSHNLYTVLSTKAGGIITTASGRSIGIPRDVSAIKCTLYAAGGFSQPLDSQSMAVVIDVDALTHEEIFNLLTNDGAIKGIYKEGNQLYISFTYAKGGTIKLGGKNNGYGILEVLNHRETGWASKLDPDGLTIFKDYVNENNYKCLIFDSNGIKYGVTDSAGLLNLETPLLVNDNGTMTILTSDIYGYSDDEKTAFQFLSGETVKSGSMVLYVKSDFYNSANFHESVTMSGLPWNSSASAAVVFASDMKTLNAAAASSIRYKSIGNGKNIKEDELEDLYRIKVIWAKYKDGYLSEQDERYGKEMPMFIAEDIDRRFPLAVDHNEKGKAENWNYRIIIPCRFAMLKNDHEKILALQADNQELHSKLDALSTEVQELKELINNISRKE